MYLTIPGLRVKKFTEVYNKQENKKEKIMSVKTVQAIINGQTYTLTLNNDKVYRTEEEANKVVQLNKARQVNSRKL